MGIQTSYLLTIPCKREKWARIAAGITECSDSVRCEGKVVVFISTLQGNHKKKDSLAKT